MQQITITTTTWLTVAAIFGLLELFLQLVLVKVCPFTPIGDEVEYLERGHSTNPFQFKLFHRLPILPTMAKLCVGTGHPVVALRLVSALLSASAMAATAGAATRIVGPVIATVLCVLLLVLPERILLGSRIWPDVYLAAATSAMALTMTLTTEPLDLMASATLTGTLVTAAILTRLDALILVPTATVSWFAFTGATSPAHLLLLTGPPTIAFLGWWLISIFFLGERWPDTTWQFNLGITVQEAIATGDGGPVVVDDLIQRHCGAEVAEQNTMRNVRSSPTWKSHIRSVFSRMQAISGPDTFVSGKLFTNENFGNGTAVGRWGRTLLLFGFPLTLATAMVVVSIRPVPAVWLVLPSASLLVPGCLFFARSRHRLPAFYGMTVSISASIAALGAEPISAGAWGLGVLVLLILGVVLIQKPRRLERP